VSACGTGLLRRRDVLAAERADLAETPADALDRAQSIFDAIASKTVRLEPVTGRVGRLKLVATAWTVGLVERLRAQLSRGR
jgi:hypothetical protein